jgi:parallel beta-helix repeat protein
VPVNVLIERVEVRGAGGGYHNYLIWNLKGQHVKIRDNWVDGGYPIPIGEARLQEGIETFGGYDVSITGNTVRRVGGACINAGSAGLLDSTTMGVVISQNYLFGCHVGVNLGTSSDNGGHHNFESMIVDNVISYTAYVGVNISVAPGTTERNLHISGNTVRVVGPGPFAVGIRVTAEETAEVDSVTIADNHLHTVTGVHGQGIRVEFASNLRLLDNTIANTTGDGIMVHLGNDLEVSRNRIERTGGYGLYIGPAAQRPIVTENVIADWRNGSPALLLEGIRYGAIHRNLFRRVDGGTAGAIVVLASCGVEMSGNQTLYSGTSANGATELCR